MRGRWCAMIEQPLPDRKRDYWGTIFNTVVPDDNSGKNLEKLSRSMSCPYHHQLYAPRFPFPVPYIAIVTYELDPQEIRLVITKCSYYPTNFSCNEEPCQLEISEV